MTAKKPAARRDRLPLPVGLRTRQCCRCGERKPFRGGRQQTVGDERKFLCRDCWQRLWGLQETPDTEPPEEPGHVR